MARLDWYIQEAVRIDLISYDVSTMDNIMRLIALIIILIAGESVLNYKVWA